MTRRDISLLYKLLEHVFYHKITEQGEKDEKNSDFYIRQNCTLTV